MTAEMLFNQIGNGIEQSVKRPTNSTLDRRLRERIEQANRTGDFIIATGQGGYYRPDFTKDTDVFMAKVYLQKEEERVRTEKDKLLSMEMYFMNKLGFMGDSKA